MNEPCEARTGRRDAGRMSPLRWLRRLLAAGLAAVMATGVWLVFSDATFPDERFSSAPDPCTLISAETVRRLIGAADGVR